MRPRLGQWMSPWVTRLKTQSAAGRCDSVSYSLHQGIVMTRYGITLICSLMTLWRVSLSCLTWEINKPSVSGTITTQLDCLAQPMQKEKKETKVPANATAANPPGLQLQRQSQGGRQPPQPGKRARKSYPKDSPLQRRPRRGQRELELSHLCNEN